MFSFEYGWKTEYILTRTTKEISWRINSINKRKNDNLKLELNLRGINPEEVINEPPKKIKTSKEDEKAINNSFQKAMLRKAKEYGRKTNNTN